MFWAGQYPTDEQDDFYERKIKEREWVRYYNRADLLLLVI